MHNMTVVPMQLIRTPRSPVAEFSFILNTEKASMWTVDRQPVLQNDSKW